MLRAKITSVVNYSCQQSLGRSVDCGLACVYFQGFLLLPKHYGFLAIILFLSSLPATILNYSNPLVLIAQSEMR